MRLSSLHTHIILNVYMRNLLLDGKVNMTPIAGLAARHNLLLWEDCAQVFTGLGGYLGHPESEAVFFSFGVIKRATALGGGFASIRDTTVLSGVIRRAYVGIYFMIMRIIHGTSIYATESADAVSCVASE